MVKIIERAQAEERHKTRLDSPYPAGKTAVDVCLNVCVWCWHAIFSPVYIANPPHPTISALKEGHEHTNKREKRTIHTYTYQQGRAEISVVIVN